MRKFFPVFLLILFAALFCDSCARRKTLVEVGDREQILYVGNGGEPADLDPQTTIGETEHDVMLALFEGLVTGNPKDVLPEPGVAERWDISPDGKIYTFHLRHDARWSNGDPITANDFIESYRRFLTPELGAQYSYMFYAVKNAEDFNTGKIKDFSQVGLKALDEHTLQVELHSPTPYFLSLIIHDSWYPVHIPTIKKYGALDDRSNPWTRPEHFVGNGAFVLKEWKMNSRVVVEKNPNYWDAKNVKLKQIIFDPIESLDTEERMFRSGQLHTVKVAPQSKIGFYQKNKPELIDIKPILSTYFFKINVTRPPLTDARVRRALAMAIDRKAICETIGRGGELPALFLTPPDTAGYTAHSPLKEDVAAAKKLLAEAGFPDGNNFPTVEILFNTLESHKAIAEAIQQMWKKNLGINVTLHNEEWKVYLDSMRRIDYFIGRAGWGGDYVDPSTFLELFIKDGGNNETGWSNLEYDRLIKIASSTNDQAKRFDAFQKAEVILMNECPIIPIYFYTRPRLIYPSVKGFYANVLDQHNYKYIWLDPSAELPQQTADK